jgi:hypothetical protein
MGKKKKAGSKAADDTPVAAIVESHVESMVEEPISDCQTTELVPADSIVVDDIESSEPQSAAPPEQVLTPVYSFS